MKRVLFMFHGVPDAWRVLPRWKLAVSAAAGAGSQAEQAKEALKTEARVKQPPDARARPRANATDRLPRHSQ